MVSELRDTGISVIGGVPWGTHFCHFYETKDDLIDILIPYFQTGLKNHEFCLWVVFDPLGEEDARNCLRQTVPEAGRYLAAGDIEIVPHSGWYLQDGAFDMQRVLDAWKRKLDEALERGYVGMRVNGNCAWLTKKEWKDFAAYEAELNKAIADLRMIVLCTYSLTVSRAGELFDVARTHQFAVAKRYGNWEIVETPALKQAKDEITRLNQELEQRVIDRTRQLQVANEALRNEIRERQRAEEALRTLSGRLLKLQDEERRRLARELHDRTAQLLAGLSINLSVVNESAAALNPRAQRAFAESVTLADQCLREIRTLSYLLYPPELDELGLQSALTRYVRGFAQRTGIQVDLDLAPDGGRLPQEIEAVLFRVAQEALTNVHRHSGSPTASVRMTRDASQITLEVNDQGSGIRSDVPTGVGIPSMRERLREVGGWLQIDSAPRGTAVKAVIPLSQAGT